MHSLSLHCELRSASQAVSQLLCQIACCQPGHQPQATLPNTPIALQSIAKTAQLRPPAAQHIGTCSSSNFVVACLHCDHAALSGNDSIRNAAAQHSSCEQQPSTKAPSTTPATVGCRVDPEDRARREPLLSDDRGRPGLLQQRRGSSAADEV